MAEWDSMLFLACPIMKELNNLVWSGLFINDLRLAAIILTASFSAEIQHVFVLCHMKKTVYPAVLRIRIRIRICMFWPPGSGSGSISQMFGSGSGSGFFYHQAKIVRKTLIPPVL